MSAIVSDIHNVIRRRINDAPLAEVVGLLQSLEPQPRLSTLAEPSFVKLSAAGLQLPADADDWVAVKDRSTGLIWSRYNIGDESYKWAKAKEVAAGVDLCGWKDWRLPTRKELLTLVDDTRSSPAINTDYFDCKSDWYWTSTEAAQSSGYAWSVDFYGGNSNWSYRYSGGFVRAVRVGQ